MTETPTFPTVPFTGDTRLFVHEDRVPDPNLVEITESEALALIEAEGLIGYELSLIGTITNYIPADEIPSATSFRVSHYSGIEDLGIAPGWWRLDGERAHPVPSGDHIETTHVMRGKDR